MKHTLTDEEIRYLCKKYRLDLLDCINNINQIKKLAKDIDCDVCKEIKILKSVEDLTNEGLLKCVK